MNLEKKDDLVFIFFCCTGAKQENMSKKIWNEIQSVFNKQRVQAQVIKCINSNDEPEAIANVIVVIKSSSVLYT